MSWAEGVVWLCEVGFGAVDEGTGREEILVVSSDEDGLRV